MDRKLIDEKLESLRRCVERIRSRCPAEVSQLASDSDLQDIVALNLTRAVQICVDIAAVAISQSPLPAPETMGGAFDALAELAVIDETLAGQMKAAVGFRNIAVHSYQNIDCVTRASMTFEGSRPRSHAPPTNSALLPRLSGMRPCGQQFLPID